MHNLAPDLWSLYGMPWDRLNALYWDEFATMILVIDQTRAARRAAERRAANG